MEENLNKVNLNNIDDKVGGNVEKTTNYLKSLSDYIEGKLYDEKGVQKNGGVKSLSLTFAMLVGFSMAIVVVSSIVITFIFMTKNASIDEAKKTTELKTVELKASETNINYWRNKYQNVYSQCDSIGYQRAQQALIFSRSLQEDFELQKLKSKNQAINKIKEAKGLEIINNKVKTVLDDN